MTQIESSYIANPQNQTYKRAMANLRSKQDFENTIDVARGLKPADLVLRGAKYLNVFSGEWLDGDIAIFRGKIVGVGEKYEASKVMNLKGRYVVPGFIDSHLHIESTCMVPDQFQKMVLPRGTTGAIVDPHEIANVLGEKGLQYILDCAASSTMDLYIMLSSCVPATSHLETSGAKLSARDLLKFKNHPNVLGLAELMNFRGLLNKDPEVIEKVMAFQDRIIDGHSPMLQGKDLNAYLSCGIHSCHESVTLEEAREKLQKGMQVLLREGSVAKNVRELCKILDAYSSPKVSLCTDDRNPVDIQDEGHIDFLIRTVIKKGIEPEVAYRSASWSTATSYGIKNKGAIAPGFDADLVVLKDYKKVVIESVFKFGRQIKSELDVSDIDVTPPRENSIRYELPQQIDLKISDDSGKFRVIEVIPNQIITNSLEINMGVIDNEIKVDLKKDILKISVLERHGHNKPMVNAFVKGFGLNSGAFGASVAHDSHNVVVVGTNDQDMLECFKWMKTNGGGFVAINNGKVEGSLALPIAGLMTEQPYRVVYKHLKALRKASKRLGCKLEEPFLQLAFLCLPVIPSLKITDLGLVDVNRFKLVELRIS